MIPRLIHWCWFGGKELPEVEQRCRESWRLSNPEWKIVLWDEETFNVKDSEFTKEAYRLGKYAFVSDYVRAWCLNRYGGVYVDADVEVMKSLESYRHNSAFTGFESRDVPFTALWGSERGHNLAGSVLKYYESKRYTLEEKPNTRFVSEIIKKRYKVVEDKGIVQRGEWEGSQLTVYPATCFCVDMGSGTAVHHFTGSWLGNAKDMNDTRTKRVRTRYMAEMILSEKAHGLKALAQYISIWEIAAISLIKIGQIAKEYARVLKGLVSSRKGSRAR